MRPTLGLVLRPRRSDRRSRRDFRCRVLARGSERIENTRLTRAKRCGHPARKDRARCDQYAAVAALALGLIAVAFAAACSSEEASPNLSDAGGLDGDLDTGTSTSADAAVGGDAGGLDAGLGDTG